MDSYRDFADVYDLFMDNVPYEEWAERTDLILKRFDEKKVPEGDAALASEAGLLVDLGCGTGTFTRLMRDRGYDCIGIDISSEMLERAMAHESDTDAEDASAECIRRPIMYLNQDMRKFELYSTVGAFVCVCDSINYLLSEEDVLSVFKLVNNYLYPHGLFVFDFNTTHYYRDVLGDSTIAETRPEACFIWENFYDDEDRINECDLTVFKAAGIPDEETGAPDVSPDALYERFEETHIQRGYEVETIIKLVRAAGMDIVAVFDSDLGFEPDTGCDEGRSCGPDSENDPERRFEPDRDGHEGYEYRVNRDATRVCVVARESGKEDIN